MRTLHSACASLIVALFLSATPLHAQFPAGQFECRDWDVQPTVLQAALTLNSDGSYQAIDNMADLTANRPSAKGHYTYHPHRKQIDFTSGGWNNRLGTYMPQVKGTDFVVIHTRRDPEGKIDGTLRCARSSPSR
jgi:hypothetical protein